MQYFFILHTLILRTLELFSQIKIGTAAIVINFIVKHHVLQTYQCIVLHENIKNYQNVCFPNDSRYKGFKNF